MFEDSPEGFISRWREQAAPIIVFPRVEGVPLIECQVAGAIIQTLERTGPYLLKAGPGKAIVNPTVREVVIDQEGSLFLEALGVGKARARGLVVRREDPFLVVDVGARLVVAVEAPMDSSIVSGTTVSFEAVPPIHLFALAPSRATVTTDADEAP